MRVYKHIDHHAFDKSSVVALGTFDGLHLGHQTVIKHMIDIGKAKDLQTVVFTFSNLPKHYNKDAQKEERILCIDDKIDLFESLGIDVLIIVPFNDKVKHMHKEAFLSHLTHQVKMKHLCVGYDFRFGKDAQGSNPWLLSHQEGYGYHLTIVDAITDGEVAISSTRIRRALKQGDVTTANHLLGRVHYVSGIVHPGKRLGRTLGFPTANLKISPNMTLIAPGVYVTETEVEGKRYQSVTNVGFNPTFDQEDFNLETYILDFDQDIYKKRIKVFFRVRIREELKFNHIEELKTWIGQDVAFTRDFYKNNLLSIESEI